MSTIGKPNATGRSSGKLTGRLRKIHSPKSPFSWHSRELLFSPAWRARSINCGRLLDFLEIEHMNHGGFENGNLKATYDQLVEYGLTRSEICPAIREAAFLGLLRYEPGGRWVETNQPSIYRLTYYADRENTPATDEWKRKTDGAIQKWKQERTAKAKIRRQKKQIPGSTSRTTVVRLSELRDRKSAKGKK